MAFCRNTFIAITELASYFIIPGIEHYYMFLNIFVVFQTTDERHDHITLFVSENCEFTEFRIFENFKLKTLIQKACVDNVIVC